MSLKIGLTIQDKYELGGSPVPCDTSTVTAASYCFFVTETLISLFSMQRLPYNLHKWLTSLHSNNLRSKTPRTVLVVQNALWKRFVLHDQLGYWLFIQVRRKRLNGVCHGEILKGMTVSTQLCASTTHNVYLTYRSTDAYRKLPVTTGELDCQQCCRTRAQQSMWASDLVHWDRGSSTARGGAIRKSYTAYRWVTLRELSDDGALRWGLGHQVAN